MIHAENLNKPTVALCHKDFVIDARSAASSKGMPTIRIVPETIPCECNILEKIEAGVSAVMDDIIAALTNPLTTEEKSPKPKTVEKLPRILFRGNLEEVNRFFYKRGWIDGLPIIPPTEAAVKEMLTGTDLSPDHVVCKLIPRLGKATVEKIATNAVMAGALPTYMPVLIAAVQALMDPIAYFNVFEVSTIGPAPLWIINGPIGHELNISSGSGCLSPGDIANATIGRAMGLIIKNIGGARKGKEDMSVFGNPGKYTMVMAENEEESPWEPLHVEHGFVKNDSTVTLFCPDSLAPMYPYGTDDKGILEAVIYNIRPAAGGLFCLLLPPIHARTFAAKDWTKKAIKAYISEYARVPAYRHPVYHRVGVVVPEQQKPPTNPLDSMSIIISPDWIRVVVAGGPGNTICLCHAGREGGLDLNFVTKKVELPSNWARLVKKYKDIVPSYVDY
jgi:hypothetical protein